MAIRNQITVFSPGFAPKTYDLDRYPKGYVLMGRGQRYGDTNMENDIQLDPSFSFVSRAHCIFQHDEAGRWRVTDNNSANGLIFHEQRVPYHNLVDGDKIYIGTDPNARIVMLFSSRSYDTGPAYGTGSLRGKQNYHTGSTREQDYSTSVLTETGNLSHPSAATQSVVKTYNLKNMKQCTIGRAPECTISINHPSISRIHCIIAQQNGRYVIYDNSSTNGVILNSRQLLRPTPLNQMDRISIAGFSFIFCNDCLYTYELSGGGVSLSVSRLCKVVGKGKKQKTITNDVNLFIEPNKFVAIIGGSGAGKTTLLDCMAGMTNFTSGEVLINGESIRTSGKSLRSLMGYVPQQDIVYDSLTLEHMLRYSAQLRMPQDTSDEEIQRKIDETLKVVELSDHRKTLISRLSGGERKRASIAVELLASPRLFFLDEPSSGLDPGTEKHLMQMLKRLSETGKTVIMVTHTVQNLDLCDSVICMGKGGVLCYAGPPKEALKFFNEQDLTDIYDDLSDNSVAMAQRYRKMAPPSSTEAAESAGTVKQAKQKKGIKKSLSEFWVMTRRYVEIMASKPLRLAFLVVIMPVLLTLLVCIAFQADGNFYNLLMRLSGGGFTVVRESYPYLVATDTIQLMFAFSCACFWVGIFNSIQEVSKERVIYERERFSGIGVFPYVMSKFVPLTILCIVQTAIMCAILMFLTNTTATVDGITESATALAYGMSSQGAIFGEGLMWLETFITTLLCVLSAMCLGLMISTLVSNEMALVLCPICLMPQILFSGVVGTLSGITKFISNFITCKWSCLAYFVSADVNTQLKEVEYKTGAWEKTTFSDGDGVGIFDAAYERTTEYLFGMNGVISGWLAMFLISAVCVAAAVLILRFRRASRR